LLYLVNEPYFFYSHRLPIARAAREHGFDVHIAAPDDHVWAPSDFDVDQFDAEGFHFHAIPLNRRGLNPFEDLKTVAALWRLLGELSPDLLHNVTIKPVLYGGILGRIRRTTGVVNAVPGLGHVFTSADHRSRLLRLLIGRLYRVSLGNPRCRAIVQNPDDGDALLRIGAIGTRRLILIPGSGVSMAEFTPAPEVDGPPLVILPARLIWAKGIAEFVEAARRLRRDGVAGRFALLGSANTDFPGAVPEAQLRQWHDEGVVEWWGRRTDMPQVYRQAHVVCLPSNYGEGVPRALIEAAAVGRAIVTTDIPGCRDIVRHGENGLLVATGDVDALAEALRRLLTDAAYRRQLGAKGRPIAEGEFTVESVVTQTLDIYHELLATERSGIVKSPASASPSKDEK
jgi:glycosyltransferase involved in cell wall biosynthesis